MPQCDQCLEHCPTAAPRNYEEHSTHFWYCSKCYNREWFHLNRFDDDQIDQERAYALELQDIEFVVSGVRARG